MDFTRPADVIVVGYGPVGQVTALLLARRGWRVLVLERWPAGYPMPRATSFDGESARILAAAGIDPGSPDFGEPTREYSWHNDAGDVLIHVEVAERGFSGWPESTSIYQPGLESALASAADRLPNVRVLRGFEVVRLTDRGTDVELVAVTGQGRRQTFRSDWVVGCDGANSMVRDAIGVSTTDFGFDCDWMSCDVVLSEPREFSPYNLQICDPARPRSSVSAGPGHRRWEFMRLPGEPSAQFGEVRNAWRLLAMFDVSPRNATLVRHNVYTFRSRCAERFRAGRVLIAGDAAHVMPPFAGQGMCAGLRDAANLAWRLDLVRSGLAGADLLDGYTVERREHARGAIATSINLGRVICQTDAKAARDRDQVMIASRQRRIGQGGRQAGTPIEEGFLHPRDEDVTGLAGTLSPQGLVARDGAAGLFDEVVGRGFVLLTTEQPERLLDTDELAFLDRLGTRHAHMVPADAAPDPAEPPAGTRYRDIDGRYLPHITKTGALAVLVRPDFYIFGAVRDGTELAELVSELRARLARASLTESG